MCMERRDSALSKSQTLNGKWRSRSRGTKGVDEDVEQKAEVKVP
jgi:hypothetical protein